MRFLIILSALMLGAETIAQARETLEEAAAFARQLVNSVSIGNMATVYPADHASLAGEPFSLQEYYARHVIIESIPRSTAYTGSDLTATIRSCHVNGSLTLLFLPISRHSQNVLLSPTHAASVSVWSDRPAASRPRVSLIGNVTVFPVLEETPDREAIQACYVAQHPDARWWLPGPREPHIAYWARFDPHSVYYVGGFGSEHFIGNIPLEMYQNASFPDHATEVGVGGRVLVTQD
ncbi:pyridoxamine 5'-phosphate oxidase-domain-containing protein [Dichomitus squalens]|uniref:Pyridoxamine 5'-phosphate oxidase-domain-containing protein n=1 Tax=Dichomitus squalens TaxID=114155 RepID=A0A4Q9PFY3_9APHY|nr:pyridoxamine 5'-phosphate oxidase-domain-containing protein [Dichomitus squalens]